MRNKKEIFIIAIFLLIQTIIYIWVGANKFYLHIDEAYSFGLANYDKIEIEANEDFFNNWHGKEYYEDYLSVQEDEAGNFTPVYENQKNDVHPPLYYLLLRFGMELTRGHFSMWTGFGLNMIIYAFITIFMYLILKKLFKDDKSSIIKSAILAFMSSIVLAALSNVVYIRMYALLTLEILITVYLHIKLLESEKINFKLLICIGISVLAGVLTHYYYLFYLVFLYLVFLIKYIKERNLRILLYYTLTIASAGIISLIIFPYSIEHMFFGYRGQGVISKLLNLPEIIPSILQQIHNLNYYGFNNMLYVIIILLVGILIYNKICKKGCPIISKENKEIIKIILLPSIGFFIIATLASPWNVLRYVVPVFGLIFVIAIYYLYKVFQIGTGEKICNTLLVVIFCMILISPLVFHMEPELLYSDRKEIVQKLGGELNLPTIYLYNSGTSGFLNDILLFSKIDESYIAKDIDYTENNIQEILKNKDVSNGIIVFINDGQDNDTIIDIVKKSLDFTSSEYLQRLWSSNVYYLH